MFSQGNVACFPYLVCGTRVHAHTLRGREASSVMREVIDIIDQILARLVRNVGFLLSSLPDRCCGDGDNYHRAYCPDRFKEISAN